MKRFACALTALLLIFICSAECVAENPMVVESSDGSKNDLQGAQINPDGSITIESGQFGIDIDQPQGSGLTQEEWEAKWNKYVTRNGVTTGTVYIDESGSETPAEILSLGIGRSTIRVNGETLLVPTSSLKWDTEAPEDKLLAVVSTKKQTQVKLRAKKSKKSFVLANCEKCRVLRVIKTGKSWTFVDVGGIRGYVQTATLTFYDNKPKQYAAAVVSYKGKASGKTTVHTRSSTARTSRQLEEYPTGTQITVFSQDEKWCEIDVDGWHCYILSEFVTLQEPLVTASAEPGTDNPSEAADAEADSYTAADAAAVNPPAATLAGGSAPESLTEDYTAEGIVPPVPLNQGS